MITLDNFIKTVKTESKRLPLDKDAGIVQLILNLSIATQTEINQLKKQIEQLDDRGRL